MTNKRSSNRKYNLSPGLRTLLPTTISILLSTSPGCSNNSSNEIAETLNGPNSDAKKLAQNSAAIDRLTQTLLSSSVTSDNSTEVQMQAQLRRNVLVEVAHQSPEAVLKYAIPTEIKESFSKPIQSYLEEHITQVEGVLLSLAAVEKDGQETIRHYLETDSGKRYSLHFPDQESNLPQSGSRILIQKAVTIPTSSYVDPLIPDSSSADNVNVLPLTQALTGTTGARSTIVILVNFQDRPSHQPWSTDSVRNTVFTNLNQFDYENSYHRTSLFGDVVGWNTIGVKSTAACDDATLDQIATEAQNAATQAGYDLSRYSHQIYIFPQLNTCGWLGLGTIGKSYYGYSQSWVNGSADMGVIGHEMGHNFGLYHANAYSCGTSPIGANCTNMEYADPSDIMGNQSSGHFNAYLKEQLAWLNAVGAPPITTVQTSGTYLLEPYETYTLNPKALKIQKSTLSNGSKDFYYLEFRQPIGADQDLSYLNYYGGNLLNGILIHQANSSNPNSSRILDMTPKSNTYYSSASDFFDSALVAGKTFQDAAAPNGGVRVSVNSVSSAGASVSVQFGTGTPVCTPAKPTLTVAPSTTHWVQGTQIATLTFTLKNNDNSSCAVSTFNLTSDIPTLLSSAVPTLMTASLSNNSMTLSPGASGSFTLQMKPSALAANGVYSAQVKAISTSNTTYQASAIANAGVSGATFVLKPVLSQNSFTRIAGQTQVEYVNLQVLMNGTPISSIPVTRTLVRPSGATSNLTSSSNATGWVRFTYPISSTTAAGTYSQMFNSSYFGMNASFSSNFTVN
jgi:hypothetical protein